ncbi:MAG: EAL domain-containing protein [Pseudomonadota bacterium]
MASADTLKSLFDGLPYAIFAKNAALEVIYGNAALSAMVGREDYVGKTDKDLMAPGPAEQSEVADRRALSGQVAITEHWVRDQRAVITSKYPVTLPDGEPGLIGIVIDVTGSRSDDQAAVDLGGSDAITHQVDISASGDGRVVALENLLIETLREKQQAIELALMDPATGLRNRAGLDQDLETALARVDKEGGRLGLTFIDLDHFKSINDRLGHDAGDAVLKELGQRFNGNDGHCMSVARLGGDEFAVVFRSDPETSAALLHERQAKVHERVFKPVPFGDKMIHMTGSMGIALYPDHATDIQTLKRYADAALLTSKNEGRNRFTFFNEDIQKAALRRREIEGALNTAISEKTLTPHVQPIIGPDGGGLLGVEVLARWTHPTLGPIMPEEFIPIAEDCGLLTRLDLAMLETAATQLKPYFRSGALKQASFNASALAITSPTYAQRLLKTIEALDLSPNHICIEIVETALVHDLDVARANLQALQNAGVCIALDDFGTGYSNLRALLDLPLDRVKIDRSLVADLDTNPKVFQLFLTIVNLAKLLEVEIVAEGLETDYHRLVAESAGITHLQGFFFAKPMPISALSTWLETEMESSVAAA